MNLGTVSPSNRGSGIVSVRFENAMTANFSEAAADYVFPINRMQTNQGSKTNFVNINSQDTNQNMQRIFPKNV